MTTHAPQDEWGTEAPNIMSAERLAAIRQTLEESPIVVEHWFFYGCSAPDRLIFDEYEAFNEYLRTKAKPGDSIWVWRFDQNCRENNCLTHGKCPDEQGLVPRKGAY
jgi:hypothetical protein